MEHTLENILKQFNIEVSIESYGNGHINDTYLCKSKPSFILQRINTNVFKNICAVMENIDRVTAHIKESAADGEKIINFLRSEDGHTYYIDENKT